LPDFSAKLACNSKVGQRIHRRVSNEVDSAAMATIATVRPTPFHVFFTPETQAAVATVTGLYADCRFVNKFHSGILMDRHEKPRTVAGFIRIHL
jgi:hypothetical protein